jgi:ubiquitin-conjugating enzyme E2 O
MDVAVADEKLCWLDLVRFRPVRGSRPVHRGLVLPDGDTFMLGRLDGSLTNDSVDLLNILDRSSLYVGRIVVSASDAGGQSGVVTGVTTVLDLAHLNDRGRSTKVIRGVSPSGVRRVRALSLGDYVVSGPWLGRVVVVSLDVDVMFDDGAVCRVTEVESKDLRPVNPEEYYRPMMNTNLYPGKRVVAGDPAAVFKEAQWLNGHWKPGREVGTVVDVEMAGVLVYWIASAQHGTKQQLVRESAPPAYHSSPDTLTLFCSSFDCCWGLADRCLLTDVSVVPRQDASSAPQPTMSVYQTHTTADVLWQDGTRQHGAPSTSLVPFSYMNEHEVFPGQYVVDNAPADDVSTRRVGFVRSVNSKDRTVNVSWFKDSDSSWEVECDDRVSAYDLGTDPDRSVFYGDVVVRLPSNITTGGTPLARETSVPAADLSWVGHVVDLHDGHVQVKWGDGSTSTVVLQLLLTISVYLLTISPPVTNNCFSYDRSMFQVLPHEIGIANKEDYAQLLVEMRDWPEFLDDAPQELGAGANEVSIHLH